MLMSRLAVGAALAATLLLAGCGSSSRTVALVTSTARFRQANLVADTADVGAAHVDPNLVNPWGISFSPTGPFWLSDNGTGLTTLYDGTGKPSSLVVAIPASGATGGGTPTGQVFTSGAGFTGNPAFAFVSEDGVLTTWAGGSTAVVRADESASGAVFKGMAIAPLGTTQNLYVADFHSGHIEVFNRNYQLITLAGAFTDPAVPSDFAPFNIQNLGGQLYVTYARKATPDSEDDEPGTGNGFVSVFSTNGVLLHHLVDRGHLNSPWGLAIAPAGFGPYGGDLLVGNFGDGEVNIYDPTSGAYRGQLLDDTGKTLIIPGLWGLAFGNGGSAGSTTTLFFSAGPDGEEHGLFGSLTAE